MSGFDASIVGIFLLLGMLLFAPVIAAVVRRSFDPIEPIYLWLALYAYLYLFKPVYRIASGESFWYGDHNLGWAMSIAVIGLLAFYVGYFSAFGHFIANRVPAMRAHASPQRLRFFALGLIALGAVGLWQYMEVSGGWREFWAQPHGFGGKAELTTAYVSQLPELMIVGFFLLIYDAMLERRLTVSSIVRVGFAFIGGVGIYTILWTRRTFILWVLITIFVMFYLIKRKRPRPIALIFFAIVLFVAMNLALAYRPYLHLGVNPDDLASVELGSSAATVMSEPGDEFDSFLAIVSLYPDRIDYDYFNIYARIFIHPIPRLVWPDKPPLFVSSWDEFLFQSGISWGASEGVLGDLYIQLGLLGVMIGMFVFGASLKFLFAYLLKASTSVYMQMFYAVALGNLPSLIIQSGISAFWKWMPFMLPGIVIAYWVTKRRSGISAGTGVAVKAH